MSNQVEPKAVEARQDPQIFRTETVHDEPEKAVPTVDKVDYSGAHAKTDPKEIALVKKLDRWIMVSPLPRANCPTIGSANQRFQPMLWSMYWLNYLDRNAIALARLDDLEKDLNLTSTRMVPYNKTLERLRVCI